MTVAPAWTQVLVSAGTLVSGRMGGSEVYVRELLRELSLIDQVELHVLAPGRDPLLSTSPGIGVNNLGYRGSAGRLLSQELMRYSVRARRSMAEFQLVHYPLQVQTPPPPKHAASVITIHDVQHLDMPEFFSRSEIFYRNRRYDAPAKMPEAIITISEFSKSRIVARLGIAPNKIHAIPLGHDIPTPSSVREPRNFVLYPANFWPHKNHRRLVAAIALLRKTRPTLQLVLTGTSAAQLPDLPKWVLAKGKVGRADLLKLYREAACVALPSLYEGFGLPALEAMASGAPVASSRSGALPEVCGDAAVYFDANDPKDICRAIDNAIIAGSNLGELGLRRAAEFSWKRCAERHVDVYESAKPREPKSGRVK